MNSKIIYYKKTLIIYNLSVNDGDIIMNVKLLHFIGIGEIIKSNDIYVLDEKTTLKSIITSYKEMIDGIYFITKKY